MQLIHDHIHQWPEGLAQVALKVERLTLAKRRWRGVADDGADFGFDLEHPLENGDAFYAGQYAVYVVEQKPEQVLEVQLGQGIPEAARLGWLFGNLHFAIQITEDVIRIADDPAVHQVCEREHLPSVLCERVFSPLGSGHHHHDHAH